MSNVDVYLTALQFMGVLVVLLGLAQFGGSRLGKSPQALKRSRNYKRELLSNITKEPNHG